jgi:hypothetical protein
MSCDSAVGAMNSTTGIWLGRVLLALLIIAYSQAEVLGIACVLGISIISIGVGLIANGLEES